MKIFIKIVLSVFLFLMCHISQVFACGEDGQSMCSGNCTQRFLFICTSRQQYCQSGNHTEQRVQQPTSLDEIPQAYTVCVSDSGVGLETFTEISNEAYSNGREIQRPTQYGPVYITLQRFASAERRNMFPNLRPRPVRVAGFIYPINRVGKATRPQPNSGFVTTGIIDVDAGHLGALHNGFPNIAQNIVPQWRHWQRSEDWRDMERFLLVESRLLSSSVPSRSMYFVVDVYYRNIRNITPTLVSWSFPTQFRVRAWNLELNRDQSINIDGLGNPDYEQMLEGYPDNWNEVWTCPSKTRPSD